jgi:MFS family permease
MSKKNFYSCNKIRGILAGFLSQFIHPYLWIMHDISPLIAAFIFNTHFRSIKTIAPPTQSQLASIETVYSLFQWIGAVFGHPLALKIGHRNLMAITSILSAIL